MSLEMPQIDVNVEVKLLLSRMQMAKYWISIWKLIFAEQLGGGAVFTRVLSLCLIPWIPENIELCALGF